MYHLSYLNIKGCTLLNKSLVRVLLLLRGFWILEQNVVIGGNKYVFQPPIESVQSHLQKRPPRRILRIKTMKLKDKIKPVEIQS